MKIAKVNVSRLISVFDGDTFRCSIDTWPVIVGHKIPIRVRGINCAERKSKDPAEIEKADAAWKFTLKNLTNAKLIQLQNVERGKYFRLIADVIFDGRNLASELLEHGLAVPYKV